jgi:hypothetical protein
VARRTQADQEAIFAGFKRAENRRAGHIDYTQQGTVTLTGGGSITLQTAADDPDPAVLTNLDNQLRGFGRIRVAENDALIEAANGTLEVSPAIEHEGTLAAAAGGTLEVTGTVAGSGTWLADGGRIHVTSDVETNGDVRVFHGGTLAVDGTMNTAHLVVDDTGSLDVNGLLKVAGNLAFDGANGGRWLFGSGSSVTFTRSTGAPVGDWSGWQRIEAAGLDLGAVAAGFTNGNFYLPELVIGPDGRLALRDQFDNGNRTPGGPEAVYVDTLVFSDALGLLDLNGLHLYYNHLVGSAAQIIDVAVPEPAEISSLNALALAVLACIRKPRLSSA